MTTQKRGVLDAFSSASGSLLRICRGLEQPVFRLLRSSDVRPIRSFRFRLFKAWTAGLNGDRAVRCATLAGGMRLMVDVRDWCGITLIEPDAIEPVTTSYLLEHLRPGDAFADIGANVGFMSLHAARRVGPSGVVWSFEPNPRLVELIRTSVRRNRLDNYVFPVAIALAEAAESDRPFYLSDEPTNSGLSSLVPDLDHQSLGRMNMLAPIRVAVTTFDSFAVDRRIERLDAIKIDVEGAEHLVLSGMRESLARFRPRFIICETGIDSPAAETLAGAGYRGRMLEAMQEDGKWGNMLFEPLGEAS